MNKSEEKDLKLLFLILIFGHTCSYKNVFRYNFQKLYWSYFVGRQWILCKAMLHILKCHMYDFYASYIFFLFDFIYCSCYLFMHVRTVIYMQPWFVYFSRVLFQLFRYESITWTLLIQYIIFQFLWRDNHISYKFPAIF